MGYTVINDDVLDNEELNIQEQSVLIALISYYNNGKGYAYPSYKQLKLRSKLKDNRTLIKTVDSLVEKGYLTKETLKGIGVKYYITKCKITPSGELHLVENYTRCKNTLPPSGKSHYDPVENYTTTNNKTNKNNNNKNGYDEILDSYTQDKELKNTILDFIKMRKAIKKPMTDKALTLLLKKLDKLSQNSDSKIELLNQSILNSWQGIFPLKNREGESNSSEWLNNRKKKTVL